MNMFPARLKDLRKQHKETQADVAKLLRTQRSTVGEYERGTITPPIEKIKMLADHYEVTVDYMMGNTNAVTIITSECDPKDVSKALKQILMQLQDEKISVLFAGDELKDFSRQFLISNLENAIKSVKLLNK